MRGKGDADGQARREQRAQKPRAAPDPGRARRAPGRPATSRSAPGRGPGGRPAVRITDRPVRRSRTSTRPVTTRVSVPSQRSSVSHFVPRTVAALLAPWVLKRPCESLPPEPVSEGGRRFANASRHRPAGRAAHAAGRRRRVVMPEPRSAGRRSGRPRRCRSARRRPAARVVRASTPEGVDRRADRQGAASSRTRRPTSRGYVP